MTSLRVHENCWLHDSVEVRPSSIEGNGLFAARLLPAGTIAARYGGRLVSRAELLERFAAAAGADRPGSDPSDAR